MLEETEAEPGGVTTPRRAGRIYSLRVGASIADRQRVALGDGRAEGRRRDVLWSVARLNGPNIR